MAISKENIDFLFDIMNYYDIQYDKITDNCLNEVERALNEICSNIKQQNISVLPFGSHSIKNNYQSFEPIEFYCILKSNRDILQKEKLQKQIEKKKSKKNKKTIKSIYQDILSTSQKQDEKTSIDVAKIILENLRNYVDEEDKIAQKNNVIFVKFHYSDDVEISVVIYVVYDFDGDGIVEFTKLGYKTKQNPLSIINNIQQKNLRTNGNYLLLCKLIKMLELELIISNQSNINLSAKTFFAEYVLYNVPDKFFKGEEFSEIFARVVNYLNICPIEKILIPDERNEKMFGQNQYYANREFESFLRKLSYICKNADEMISYAIMQNNSNADINESVEDNQSVNDSKPINKINKNQ